MKILLTAGLGAVTMYFMDPSRGRHRRALAQARLEHGRESLKHGVHKAKHGLDQATYRSRVLRRNVGRKTGKAVHGARSLGHDIGEQADQLTRGARVVGREARVRAAGAAATVGSLFSRTGAGEVLPRATAGRPRARVLLIPVTWLVTIGCGAAAVYYFAPSQGLYRRARLRNRLARWRLKMRQKAGALRRGQAHDTDAGRPHAGNGSDRELENRPRGPEHPAAG